MPFSHGFRHAANNGSPVKPTSHGHWRAYYLATVNPSSWTSVAKQNKWSPLGTLMVKEEACSVFALLSLHMGREVLEPSRLGEAIPVASAKVWHQKFFSMSFMDIIFWKGQMEKMVWIETLPACPGDKLLPSFLFAAVRHSSLLTTVHNKGAGGPRGSILLEHKAPEARRTVSLPGLP